MGKAADVGALLQALFLPAAVHAVKEDLPRTFPDAAQPYPSCLQAVSASGRSQRSSHTIPQTPWWKSSTRLAQLPRLPTSRVGAQPPGEEKGSRGDTAPSAC